jgi:hypothetical protein
MKYDGFVLIQPKMLVFRKNYNLDRKIATKKLALVGEIHDFKLNISMINCHNKEID